jgi:hypothetical protein
VKVLKKVDYECEKCGYKWVIEEVCKGGEAKMPCTEVLPGADVPPPPDTDVKLWYRMAPIVPVGANVGDVPNPSYFAK